MTLTRDEIAVIAIFTIFSHAIVNGGRASAAIVRMALIGPEDRLGSAEARDVTAAAVQVTQA